MFSPVCLHVLIYNGHAHECIFVSVWPLFFFFSLSLFNFLLCLFVCLFICIFLFCCSPLFGVSQRMSRFSFLSFFFLFSSSFVHIVLLCFVFVSLFCFIVFVLLCIGCYPQYSLEILPSTSRSVRDGDSLTAEPSYFTRKHHYGYSK